MFRRFGSEKSFPVMSISFDAGVEVKNCCSQRLIPKDTEINQKDRELRKEKMQRSYSKFKDALRAFLFFPTCSCLALGHSLERHNIFQPEPIYSSMEAEGLNKKQ